jgi:cytoskeletal protein CcmA (bactofilin family)
VDNRRQAVVTLQRDVLTKNIDKTPGPCQPNEAPVFKRRKPDDPQTEPGTILPAGLSMPDQGDILDPPVGRPGVPPDNGLGVPPFRPAQPPQEVQTMSRQPFTTAPTPQTVPTAPGVRPGLPPIRPATRDPAERRTLVVGRGISLQGTVQDAERLVVEGTIEATMIHATELAISPGGIFKGEIEVEDAEIAGTIDGTLTARGSLIVRATGKVLGTARCRRLQVEDGGQITGHMEMLASDQSRSEPTPRPISEPVP